MIVVRCKDRGNKRQKCSYNNSERHLVNAFLVQQFQGNQVLKSRRFKRWIKVKNKETIKH